MSNAERQTWRSAPLGRASGLASLLARSNTLLLAAAFVACSSGSDIPVEAVGEPDAPSSLDVMSASRDAFAGEVEERSVPDGTADGGAESEGSSGERGHVDADAHLIEESSEGEVVGPSEGDSLASDASFDALDGGDAQGPQCGDGVVEGPEACDEGEGNSDTDPDSCRLDCTLPACGDGVVDTGESCDDGDLDNTDLCTTACTPGLDLPKPGPGDLVFTEVMIDPQSMEDPSGEWIEVFNTRDEVLSLADCTLRDEGTDAWVLGLNDEPSLLGGGLYGVMMFIGPGASLPPNVNAAAGVFAYQNMLLANTQDSLILECEGLEVDRIAWDSAWPIESGASLSLDPIALSVQANDDPENWCPAETPFEMGDLGTPMDENPVCPPPTLDGCRVFYEEPLPYVGGELRFGVDLVEKGLTDQGLGTDVDEALWLELGVGPSDSLPEELSGWAWVTPQPDEDWQDSSGVDRWWAQVPAVSAGPLALAARASLDQGETWVYCDAGAALDTLYLSADELSVEIVTNPCEAVSCDAPPAALCLQGQTLYVSPKLAQGTCKLDAEGLPACDYDVQAYDCGLLGQVCSEAQGCYGGAEPPASPGQLVITEMMVRPLASLPPSGQWFELMNVADTPLDLAGCVFSVDELWSVEVDVPLVVGAGERRVFGGLDVEAANGGVTLDWAWGSALELGSSSGVLRVSCAEVLIDQVSYVMNGQWPSAFGAALSLSPFRLDHLSNDDPDNWCQAMSLFGDGDSGSPGELNPPCEGDVDPIDACFTANAASLSVSAGTQVIAGVWLKEAGLTELTPLSDPSPSIVVEALLTEVDAIDDVATWVHIPADPTTLWEIGFEEGPLHYDGYASTFTAPAPGTKNLLFRVSADGGNTWSLCDRTDDGAFDVETVSVVNIAASPCHPSPCTPSQGALCDEGKSILESGEATCALADGEPICHWSNTTLLEDCAAQGATCLAGECTDYPPWPQEGEVVISELLIVPGDGQELGEWFELTLSPEASSDVLELAGCVVKSGPGESWNVSSEVLGGSLLYAGQPLVFARELESAPLSEGEQLSYASALVLANESDELELTCGGVVVDALSWSSTSGWVVPVGQSLALSGNIVSTEENDSAESWCVGGVGTPGSFNPLCPPPDGMLDDCRLEEPSTLQLNPGVVFAVSGFLRDEGTTDMSPGVDPFPGLVVETGYGPSGTDPLAPDSGWAWGVAYPDPFWSDGEAPGEDRWQGPLVIDQAGEWDVVLRASADGGASWSLCDRDGALNGYDSAEAGHITVGAGLCVPNPCDSPPPPSCDGDVLKVYASLGGCQLAGEPLAASCAYDHELFDCAPYGGCVSGACAAPPKSPDLFGALMISEFMRDSLAPAPDPGEWIELYNPGAEALDLRGCHLGDPSHSLEGLVPVLIAPSGYALITKGGGGALGEGVASTAALPSLTLGNVEGTLSFVCDAGVIDDVTYTLGWPGSEGVSMQLSPSVMHDPEAVLMNDSADVWCNASQSYGESGNLGTPGGSNSSCSEGELEAP